MPPGEVPENQINNHYLSQALFIYLFILYKSMNL